jgi:plasmid replication initiation protein
MYYNGTKEIQKMGKKNIEIAGQICFDLNYNTQNYVVQSNELIEGKQNLKLNSAKIMRALIMQIKPTDDDLKSYIIRVPELSQLLDVGAENLYRNMDSITDDILTNHVAIKDPNGEKFIKIQWVTACVYEKGVGLAVKMNPLLKPFLLNLQAHYTQYQLENILAMKSVYAIRIYELLQKEQIMKYIPKEGTSIVLTVQQIREACDCEDKYEKISQFKAKVIDVAVREIQRTTTYTVSYDCIKKGRTIEAIRFFVNTIYH